MLNYDGLNIVIAMMLRRIISLMMSYIIKSDFVIGNIECALAASRNKIKIAFMSHSLLPPKYLENK